MFHRMRNVVLACLLAFGLCSVTEAVADPILSVDDAVFGIDSITRDPNSGLDWLDLTFTAGRSFNDINSQLGLGGEFEGFHHASGADVFTLFTNAGISDINSVI